MTTNQVGERVAIVRSWDAEAVKARPETRDLRGQYLEVGCEAIDPSVWVSMDPATWLIGLKRA
jgi:hypothetical protein